MEDHIFHQNDDPSLGLVTFIPFVGYDDAVNEFSETGFSIAPNPITNDNFTLILEKALPSEMVIYNLNGQLIKSQQIDNKENTINIESLESGVYFVEVKNAGGKTVKRIVVR